MVVADVWESWALVTGGEDDFDCVVAFAEPVGDGVEVGLGWF